MRNVKQCKTCPWRVGSTVDAIPNYERGLHEKLTCTIAKPGRGVRIMNRQQIQKRAQHPERGTCHVHQKAADR